MVHELRSISNQLGTLIICLFKQYTGTEAKLREVSLYCM